MSTPSLRQLLMVAVKSDASDLHIGADEVPAIRTGGAIKRLNMSPLTSVEVRDMANELMTDRQRAYFHQELSVDFSFAFEEKARFRVNVYNQSNGVSLALRRIPADILSLQQLNMPSILEQIAEISRGLVLVTGPTGSGKSTTQAAVINHINRTRSEHILTIEDPIEFLHTPNRCIINQREIGAHARSFSKALRSALREDPDVILVGEMRDLETISLAITAAETGHLVLGTLHTNSCPESIDRIIDAYPAEEQKQIRVMLSNALKAVVSQVLVPQFSGQGRMALQEIMLVNPAIRNLIRENKVHQIHTVMDTARGQGMQTMNTAIKNAVQQLKITPQKGEEIRIRLGIRDQADLSKTPRGTRTRY
ncbi:MAG: type IV pilus twitching motility protein PilT [Myxococcota bacterium]|nr:type IV pilus twitching motility protein PilT [Myxococcota bacterium]